MNKETSSGKKPTNPMAPANKKKAPPKKLACLTDMADLVRMKDPLILGGGAAKLRPGSLEGQVCRVVPCRARRSAGKSSDQARMTASFPAGFVERECGPGAPVEAEPKAPLAGYGAESLSGAVL